MRGRERPFFIIFLTKTRSLLDKVDPKTTSGKESGDKAEINNLWLIYPGCFQWSPSLRTCRWGRWRRSQNAAKRKTESVRMGSNINSQLHYLTNCEAGFVCSLESEDHHGCHKRKTCMSAPSLYRPIAALTFYSKPQMWTRGPLFKFKVRHQHQQLDSSSWRPWTSVYIIVPIYQINVQFLFVFLSIFGIKYLLIGQL